MRVTKTMREYIEKKLTEKRLAANKAASAAYQKRRSDCSDAIEIEVNQCRAKVEQILREYDMDTEIIGWKGSSEGAAAYTIVGFNDGKIHKREEFDALCEAENARYHAQQEAIEEIIFDAEAGGDKDSLLAAIATVQF